MVTKLQALILRKTEWEEDKHPRAKDGRFGSKAGSEGKKAPATTGAEPAKTADFTAGGQRSIAQHKGNVANEGKKALLEFGRKIGVPESKLNVSQKGAEMLGDEDGYQFILNDIKPFAEKAGMKADLVRLHNKFRIQMARTGIRAKVRHGGEAPGWAGGKPAPKVGEKERAQVAHEIFDDGARDLYLYAKGKIGRNDKLHAFYHSFDGTGFDSKEKFKEFVIKLAEIGDKEGMNIYHITKLKILSNEYMDKNDEKIKELENPVEMKKPAKVGIPLIERVKAAFTPGIRKLVQQFRDNPTTSIKKTDSGGVNSDVNYVVTIKDDGRACMKGVSKYQGSEYGMPASEVFAYEASALIGFDSIQPTTYRTHEGSIHSIQQWVEDGVVGSKIWDPPEQTPALLDSISQIAVYDFAMVNRDRNSGNWMLDTKNNVMKGIDNGLVGLECGRGTMSVRRIFTEYTPDNTENYCRKLTKKSIGKIITREHFEKAKAFVESPAYDELIDAHYGPGTQGGDDLDKSGIDLDKFKKNLHAGSKMGIKTLEDILISEGK